MVSERSIGGEARTDISLFLLPALNDTLVYD